MWEAISEIFNGSNAGTVISFLLIIVVIAFFLIRTNTIQINTPSVRIGMADRERNIIRQQQDYVWNHLKEAEANLPKDETYDSRLGQIIIMTAFIEYVKWIGFNHLSRSEAYIAVKQASLVSLINSLTVKEQYKNEAFIDYIKEDTKDTILKLIEIREVFRDM